MENCIYSIKSLQSTHGGVWGWTEGVNNQLFSWNGTNLSNTNLKIKMCTI